MEEKKIRPQDKWDAKAGMVPKTYKVKKEAAEAFAETCKAQGVAVGIKLSELMMAYAEQHRQ
ncbi:MAG: hypothetical protein Q4E91_11240 [Lachnospiraceae bacterium]|nr:hypothetical protein [Lachnospiraceae bacterium]